MKKRMTLTFKSKKGNEYLYDDSTGLILPWSKEDEKILKQLLEGNKTGVIPNSVLISLIIASA